MKPLFYKMKHRRPEEHRFLKKVPNDYYGYMSDYLWRVYAQNGEANREKMSAITSE
jgi:hypothetical protein